MGGARITRTTRSLLYSFVDVDAIGPGSDLRPTPTVHGPRKYKCTREHRPRSRSAHGSAVRRHVCAYLSFDWVAHCETSKHVEYGLIVEREAIIGKA